MVLQDFHILGGSIVSCGMDHSLKLWQLDTSEIKDAIEASERPPIKKLVWSPYKGLTGPIMHYHATVQCPCSIFIITLVCKMCV